MGYGGPLGGLKELARGSRRPRPSLVSRRDLRAEGRCVRGGCGRKRTALACGAGLAAGRGRRGAASGPSVLAGPERSEGEAGRAQRGKRSELGPRGWAGALGWTETGPRSRVGLLDRARLVGLSAGVVWAGFGLSLGPVGFGCGFVFPFPFLIFSISRSNKG